MKTSELIFVGIRGAVLALSRTTGQVVWEKPLKGTGFVNVLLEGERVFASTYGEIFCLDARTGKELWHNRLKGYGIGLATIATNLSHGAGAATLMAEVRRREEEAAGAAAATM